MVAQDTLPAASVKRIGAKIIISWRNNYGARIANINIQRSTDSLKHFTTIGTVLNPLNRENGFVDAKAPNLNMFYRVFVAFEGGSYIYTKSYRPTKDSISLINPDIYIPPIDILKPPSSTTPATSGFVPSKFVYTNRENNVIINLPLAAKEKYSIKFFTEKDEPLFSINRIKEPYLIIEKVNFIRAGWYHYHLLNNDIVLEKFKFHISKESKNGTPIPEPEKKNR
ncbi:MAG: hypothetical protein ACOYKE_04760 [Ferruginibacter sp.]